MGKISKNPTELDRLIYGSQWYDEDIFKEITELICLPNLTA